ncbi:MAG: hypothetical protein HY819_15320 [Acidobacteria bacterium]|nr:hypothetical protein [Acidobacteriota bacterium]
MQSKGLRIFFITVFLLTLIITTSSPIQNAAIFQKKPLNKAEIISKLEAVGRHETTQGDVAAEINERGIDFPLTDAALGEFRKAGARSIIVDALLRAASNKSMPTNDLPEEPAFNSNDLDEEVDPTTKAKQLASLPFIEQARYYALTYVQELPNFIVNQKVQRYTRDPNSGQWRARDVLEMEVTYEASKGETYKLKSVNGRPANNGYDNVGGASSTGEFGTILVAIFRQGAKTQFKQGPNDRIEGRNAVIYDFRILTPNSTYQVTETRSNKSVISGYKGSIWIDQETKRVLRIEQSADDIPPNFPITVSESAVDYSWFEINGEKYLLPKRAELIIGSDKDRLYSRNVLEFTNYRRFDTDIKIGVGGDDD